MRKDVIIVVALIAAGLIAYLTWREGYDNTILNTDAPDTIIKQSI